MRAPLRASRPLFAFLLLIHAAAFAQPLGVPAAQPMASASVSPWTERGSLRLRYGAAMHRGSYADVGPGLSYRGLAPNEFGVSGDYFFTPLLGLQVALEREGYGLYDGDTRVTDGQFLRAGLGPLARYRKGLFRVDGGVAYAFSQLPSFADSRTGVLGTGQRQALRLHATGRLYLSQKLSAQLSAELPLTLSAKDGAGGDAKASGLGAGLALSMALGRTETFGWGAVVDYQFARDRLESASGAVADRRLHRFGMALELMLLEPLPKVVLAKVEPPPPPPPPEPPPPPPPPGALRLSITNLSTGEPVAGAAVVVSEKSYVTDAQGKVSVEGLPVGPASLEVTAEGYAPASAVASMAEGLESEVSVQLVPEGKKVPATLSGKVRSRQAGTPVQATLEIPQAKLKFSTDAKGTFSVEVPEGTYRIVISAPGFRGQTKSVTLREGEQAIFNVDLAAEAP